MDPEREDLERHIAEVKQSLASRLDVLGGRLNRARETLEVRHHVREHIGPILGIATAIGFVLGRRSGKLNRALLLAGEVQRAPRRGFLAGIAESLIRSAATTILAAVVAKFVKEEGDDAGPGQVPYRAADRPAPGRNLWDR